MLLGLDTASVAGNKNPNWIAAKAGGLGFAILRSNYGDQEDTTFKRDWPKLKDAGLTRGAYIFFRFPHPKYQFKCPTPEAQAMSMCTVLDKYGGLADTDFPPALDVEFPDFGDVRGGRLLTGPTKKEALSPETCLEHFMTAYTILKDHFGCEPMIYTSGRVWKEDLLNIAAPGLVECPLWLARYFFKKGPAMRDGAKITPAMDPPVPPPWGDATNWWIHQYQGDAVDFPGIPTGNIDLNRFNTLYKGAKGDRVRWVQRKLGLPENGKFDEAMAAAVRDFQGDNDLVADAMIGVRSFVKLCWT